MSVEIHHPSELLADEMISRIREVSFEAERLKDLHPRQLEIIFREKWFKMFLPKVYGGLELSLPEILKIEESLSWADGSIGWVVTLCSGAGWFIGFVDAEFYEIFKDDFLCVAGSGATTGFAEITDDGYEISGAWKYASGSLHATAFTLNCYITKNKLQLYNEDGSPIVSSFILKKEEVRLQKTWNSMGMVATASHSFEINKLRVPKNRSFSIEAKKAILKDAVYQYPFLQLAETTLAVNLSGMAIRFVDLSEDFLTERQKTRSSSDGMQTVLESRRRLDELRKLCYSRATGSWEELLSKNEISPVLLTSISEASHQLVRYSREVVNTLYPLCGLLGADTTTEINRVWRNFHTASQHVLFNRY